MTATLLKRAFDVYYELPLTVWESMAALGEVLSYDKEQVLKKPGTADHFLYLIIKGSGGILLWNKNKFICVDMLFEGEFFGDYLSFIQQQPTPYEVLTFEPAELFRISYHNFDNFTRTNEYGDKIWRYATRALYIDKHYQQIQLLTMTAAERYAVMMQHQPFIIQRIPQKYIASYLGVTPQSLSRIRKQSPLR